MNINYKTPSSNTPPLSSYNESNQQCNYYTPPTINSMNDNQKDNLFFGIKGVTSRLCEIDSRITKYSDFLSLSYSMFIWSLLCLLLSIWTLTRKVKDGDIIIDEDEIENEFESVNSNNNWYHILCFVVNIAHVGGYFYAIRTYNHQSSRQMINTHLWLIALAISNVCFFFIYIVYISEDFITFCVDLLYLIFNILLSFQSKDLTLLYKEKESIKIMYQ